MLSDIHAKVRNSVLTYHWKWVEGHQTDHGTSFLQLDRWGQLNHKADQLAKAYALACITTGRTPTPQVFHDEGWRIYLHGKKLSSLHFDSVYTAIYGSTRTTYWTKKRNLPAPTTNIDWPIIHSALSSLPFGKKRWLIKHLTGFCGVGKMMHRWGKGTSHCPRCDRIQEDTLHVIVCPAPRAKTVWELSIQALSQWMLDNKTLPPLRTFIIQALRRWKQEQDPPSLPTYDTFGLHQAIITQTRIGWKNFLDGFISTEWRQVQDRYYAWLAIRRTGKRWVTALLVKLWDVSWTMWDDRNDALHTAITPRKAIEIQVINATIRTLYLDGAPLVLRRDRRLFNIPLDIILSRSLPEKYQWTDTVQLAQAALINYREWAPPSRTSHRQAQLALRAWLNTAVTNPSLET
jgi:hypothetical protein